MRGASVLLAVVFAAFGSAACLDDPEFEPVQTSSEQAQNTAAASDAPAAPAPSGPKSDAAPSPKPKDDKGKEKNN